MFAVNVKVHPHVKTYIESKLPDRKLGNDPISIFISNILTRKGNSRNSMYDIPYRETVTLYISNHKKLTTGGSLNKAQTMSLNNFIRQIIMKEFWLIICTYLSFHKSLKDAIEHARQVTGINEDCLATDTIIKDFQRRRERSDSKIYIYNK